MRMETGDHGREVTSDRCSGPVRVGGRASTSGSRSERRERDGKKQDGQEKGRVW